MAETSWPSPNHNSRAVNDSEYERLSAPTGADGLVGTPGDPALVYADGSARAIRVRNGRYAWVRGHAWHSGATDNTVTVTANSSGSTRLDLVVLRLDRSTWDVTTVVKTGTPGAGSPPSTQTDTGSTGLYELPLAVVTVVNGASVISASDVSTRAWYIGEQLINCTSSTRPPHALGRRIKEADTGRQYTSTGVSWQPVVDDQSAAVRSYSPDGPVGWGLGSSGTRSGEYRLYPGGLVWFRATFTFNGTGRFAVSSPNAAVSIPTSAAGYSGGSGFYTWGNRGLYWRVGPSGTQVFVGTTDGNSFTGPPGAGTVFQVSGWYQEA